jgi:hypothetical protein
MSNLIQRPLTPEGDIKSKKRHSNTHLICARKGWCYFAFNGNGFEME